MLRGVRTAGPLRRLQTAASQLDFSDPRQVFHSKTTAELARSLAVLKLCSQDWFVDNALTVSGRARRRVAGHEM